MKGTHQQHFQEIVTGFAIVTVYHTTLLELHTACSGSEAVVPFCLITSQIHSNLAISTYRCLCKDQ